MGFARAGKPYRGRSALKQTYAHRRMIMAFCSQCGKEVEEGAGFCANCGAPVENTESVAVKTNAGNISTSGQAAAAEPVSPAAPTASAVQSFDAAGTTAEETSTAKNNKLLSVLSKVPFLAKLTGPSEPAEQEISDADLSSMDSQASAGGIRYANGKNELILKENELVMHGETGS